MDELIGQCFLQKYSQSRIYQVCIFFFIICYQSFKFRHTGDHFLTSSLIITKIFYAVAYLLTSSSITVIWTWQRTIFPKISKFAFYRIKMDQNLNLTVTDISQSFSLQVLIINYGNMFLWIDIPTQFDSARDNIVTNIYQGTCNNVPVQFFNMVSYIYPSQKLPYRL